MIPDPDSTYAQPPTKLIITANPHTIIWNFAYHLSASSDLLDTIPSFILMVYFDVVVVRACSVVSDCGTVAHQAPLFMRFSRQEYWSGLPFPPAGYLSDTGIERMSPVSPAQQADSLPLEPLVKSALGI